MTADPAVPDRSQEVTLRDAGALHNTLLQLLSQMTGTVFAAGVTLYLVRALGSSGFGILALATSISGLLLVPAGLGLPHAVGRFLADHLRDPGQLRAILALGLKLQAPAALLVSLVLFAAAGLIAHAYGHPRLAWPLRWMALSIFGQAVLTFLMSVGASLRRSAVNLWMNVIESVIATAATIAFVVAGAGAAGAALGETIGFTVATLVGLFMVARLVGGLHRRPAVRSNVSMFSLSRYAGAMLMVDVAWASIAQIDVLLIGALLSSVAVGTFGGVFRILTVLGYLGTAVAGAVAPRLSLGPGASTETDTLSQGIRYIVLIQGLIIAPMIVWAQPITRLLLGPGYAQAPGLVRVLTLYFFVGAPAALLSLTVTYLGEARRRVPLMIGTLTIGIVVTYVLIRAVGVVGAGIGDDVVQVAYVGGHLWICARLLDIDLGSLAGTVVRTLLAAGAMALILLALGTRSLAPWQWVLGAGAGGAAYVGVLVISGALSRGELRIAGHRLLTAARPGR